MADDLPPQKTPLIFFRTDAGSEPVRERLKGLVEAERQAIWEGPLAGAMAVAGGYAAVPPVGRRTVGSPDGTADEAHGACAALSLPRPSGRFAWVYQEDADDAA